MYCCISIHPITPPVYHSIIVVPPLTAAYDKINFKCLLRVRNVNKKKKKKQNTSLSVYQIKIIF